MIGEERCVHGNSPVKKVCFSPNCEQPAFVNLGCEECEAQHDHDGNTIYESRATLLAKAQNILDRKPNQQKMKAACTAAERVAEAMSQISGEIVNDFQKVDSKLEMKPQLQATIEKVRSGDEGLTGNDIYLFNQAYDNKDLFLKKDPTQDKRSLLRQLYSEFFDQLQKSIESFEKQKVALFDKVNFNENDKKVADPNPPANRPTKVGNYIRPEAPVRPATVLTERRVKIPGTQKYFDNVADIEPREERLNLLVKVLWTKLEQSNGRNVVRCLLGDETGCVQGCFDSDKQKAVKKDAVLEFNEVRAHVFNRKILIQIYHQNSISVSKLEIGTVNRALNRSAEPVNN